MMDDLSPAGIWEEKGADYQAPYGEVRDRLAAWLVEENRPLWDKHTPHKTAWHLARQSGLEAWSAKEAELRMRPHYRERYSLRDWQEWHVLDSIGIRGDEEFKDPHWQDFFETMRTEGGLTAWRCFIGKAELKPWRPSSVERLFCLWWDRFFVPLEFWTYPAMARLFEKLGARIIDEDTLRQWVRRLNLKKAPKPIVTKWDKDVPKVNVAARRYHGLPPSQEQRGKHDELELEEMRRRFEADFTREGVLDEIIELYKDIRGRWICVTREHKDSVRYREWRWDD